MAQGLGGRESLGAGAGELARVAGVQRLGLGLDCGRRRPSVRLEQARDAGPHGGVIALVGKQQVAPGARVLELPECGDRLELHRLCDVPGQLGQRIGGTSVVEVPQRLGHRRANVGLRVTDPRHDVAKVVSVCARPDGQHSGGATNRVETRERRDVGCLIGVATDQR